mgnify:CR=1 FL=1
MTGSRGWAALVGVVMVAALLWPVVRQADGFPLSNYPMFSRERPPQAQVFHIVAFSSRGEHRPVSPDMLGTEEVMQAHQTVKLAMRSTEASAELCRDVAARLSTRRAWDDVEALEVRMSIYDTIAYWQGDRTPRRSRVTARCEVSR